MKLRAELKFKDDSHNTYVKDSLIIEMQDNSSLATLIIGDRELTVEADELEKALVLLSNFVGGNKA